MHLRKKGCTYYWRRKIPSHLVFQFGGKPLDERPQGKQLLKALKPGDVVIASKLDRMFRSATDALRVLEDMKKRGVSLILLDMGGDVTGDGIAQLVFTILSAVAQFERERLQERIKDVKEDQRKRNRYLGGSRPFGYVLGKKGELKSEKREQNAIRNILEQREAGKSLRAISTSLKEQGFDLSHMAVQRILRDQAVK